MKKKISAKILITQLVILCMTLFIFPMKLKADEVSYPYFLYNVHHTYEVDNDFVLPFRHKYEFYIHANHEVTGRFIISVTTPSGSSSHTWWCESGGEIYNNQIMDRSTGTTVFVTGQQDLKVTLMYLTDSAIDIMNVRSILFSQTDLDGNIITSDQSLWSEVQKIEDHTYQILAAAGFVNQNLSDIRSQLTSISNLITTSNQTLSSLLTTATNILTKVTSIDTALQNIDNTIDTISWQTVNYTLNGFKSGDDINSIKSNLELRNGTYSGKYMNMQITGNVTGRLLKIIIPFRSYGTDQINKNIKLYSIEYAGVELKEGLINYFVKNNFNTSVLYIDMPYSVNTVNINIIFESPYNVNYYMDNYSAFSVVGITPNDIEYWQLLGYMNQYRFYKQQEEDNKTIIEKLSELILGNNTTNQSVSNNDQSNQQFNQQQQQYDQIESTFQSSFTTDQQAVQQTFSNNSLTIFADTALWFTQQLNALYNASGQMKILFTMPLLLGLALFFIGRGAKTASPNTITEVYDSYDPINNSRSVVKTTRGTAKGRAFGGYSKRYGDK